VEGPGLNDAEVQVAFDCQAQTAESVHLTRRDSIKLFDSCPTGTTPMVMTVIDVIFGANSSRAVQHTDAVLIPGRRASRAATIGGCQLADPLMSACVLSSIGRAGGSKT
jgi:hypothetical protein